MDRRTIAAVEGLTASLSLKLHKINTRAKWTEDSLSDAHKHLATVHSMRAELIELVSEWRADSALLEELLKENGL